MYHPDEKELDRLSAEAAERYQPPGTPSWDALEQTLDIELPQEKEKKRRGLLLWFLLPGLLLGGIAYWHYRQPSPAIVANTMPVNAKPITDNTNTSANNQNTTTGNNKLNPDNRILLPAKKPLPMPNSHTLAATPAKNSSNPYQPARITNTPARHTVIKQYEHSPATTPGHGGSHRNNTVQSTGKAGQKRPKANNTPETAGTDNSKSDDKTIANNNDVTPPPPITSQADPITSGKRAADTITAKKDSTVAVVTNKKKKTTINGKAISIGVTGGLDMSTVKFDYADNAGYNIGLTAGYHFSKNWSVHTGAIYTQKNYKLSGEYYHTPAGSWLSNYNLDLVQGYCRMLELPVTGRYTFNSHTTTHLFVNAGLSTYFMKQEYYSVDYKVAGNPRNIDWTYDKNTNYWFSILNFSAGLEKQLGSHLFGTIEPYAKLPLAGLGYGKIQLSSFGVNLTLEYRKKVGK